MELNVEEQTEKLQQEISQLTGQLQQIDSQLAQLQQAKNNQIAAILKKQGALELIQNLNGEKPKDPKVEPV